MAPLRRIRGRLSQGLPEVEGLRVRRDVALLERVEGLLVDGDHGQRGGEALAADALADQ